MSKLSIHKETLTELTPDQMASVVGGELQLVASCIAASCITKPIVIHTTGFCG